MGLLQNLRDIIAIIRDLLLIVFLGGLIIGGVFLVNTIGEIKEEIGNIEAPFLLGEEINIPVSTIEKNSEKFSYCELLGIAGSLFEKGKEDEGMRILEVLEEKLRNDGKIKEAEEVEKLKSFVNTGNYTAAEQKGEKLAELLKCDFD